MSPDTLLIVAGVLLCGVAVVGLGMLAWKQASVADRLQAKREAPLSPEARRALHDKLTRIAQRRLREVS